MSKKNNNKPEAAKKPIEAAEEQDTVGAVDLSEAVAEQEAEAQTAAEKAESGSAKKGGFKINKRNLKHGTMSVVLTIVFIAAVVVFNVIVGIVSDRFDTNVDLTSSGVYTLEEVTEEYLRGVEKDITITVLNSESNYEALGDPYKQVNEILKKMQLANPQIRVEYKVLNQNPEYASKFETGEIAANYIVVECDSMNRRKVLKDDLAQAMNYGNESEGYITFDFDSYYEAYMAAYYAGESLNVYDYVYSNIEQDVISALMYCTNDELVRVAFTEGYEELDSGALQSLLSDNGYQIETLNLMKVTEIDPEIDFIVMFAPQVDVDNDNLTKLDKYLDNGGAFGKNLIYFASETQPQTPNIESFLNEWGLSVDYSVVMQSDSNYYYVYDEASMYIPHSHLQQICDTKYAGSAYGDGRYTYGAYMRPVVQLWDGGSKGNIEQEILMQSYDGAFLYPLTEDSDFNLESAEKGIYNDAVMAYKVHSKTQEVTRLAVFGSDMLANSYFMGLTNGNNSKFLINMFNHICGKEEGITITPKSFTTTGFDMTAQQADTLAIVLCIVIPVLVITAGIIIWIRRRHR